MYLIQDVLDGVSSGEWLVKVVVYGVMFSIVLMASLTNPLRV